MKQLSLGANEYAVKPKKMRREKFPEEMEAVAPWSRLIAVVEPHYPKKENGTIPDESMQQHFRHLLEKHELTAGLFGEVNAMLTEQGLLLREGKRDPEMTPTKKGNQWYFGMKVHNLGG